MKYIIDVPETPMFATACYSRNGSPIATNITEFEPYTEPDRQAVEDEVWEFVRIITDMTEKQREECFGKSTCDLDEYLTYQEAKAKYEAWQKEEDQIHVGYEVHHKELPELKIYVTDMDDNSFGGFALCRVENVCDYGDRFSECNVHQYKPTWRVLPNIVELLKKMKEEEE